MWPFKRRTAQHDGSSKPTKATTEPPPRPRLANHETYGQFVTDDVALTLMVGTFNHAIMRPRGNANVRMPAIEGTARPLTDVRARNVLEVLGGSLFNLQWQTECC